MRVKLLVTRACYELKVNIGYPCSIRVSPANPIFFWLYANLIYQEVSGQSRT
jgi:hypothetical protein